MDSNPEAKPKTVRGKFSTYNGETINKYIKQWRKERNKKGIEGDIPDSSNVNIEKLVRDWSVNQLKKDKTFRHASKAVEMLVRPQFLTKGGDWDGVPPWTRPEWLYPWQPLAIDLMRSAHCMYIGSRQKVGKTLAATIADMEEMIINPGTVITLVAPTNPLARALLHQMFHETIVLKTATKVGNRYEIIPTGERLNIWDLFGPYFITDNKLEKVMRNGSRIQVLTLDTSAVSGLAADIVHIEEFDKVVRLTKQGGSSDKLAGLAALLPQLRARPNAKIRITCNMSSGLFDLLRDALYQFGHYFPIYMETPNPTERFAGLHHIDNQDAVYMDKEGIPVIPDIDDILKVLMGVLMGSSFVQMQLQNIRAHSEEVWNPKKVKSAYTRGKKIDQERTIYPETAMGADPGAGHAYAFNCFAKDGSGRATDMVHLWSRNYYSADSWNTKLYSSKLEEMGYEVAEKYCTYHCQFFATESNAGAKMITPYIGAAVERLLNGDPRFKLGRSKARWFEKYSNFGREVPEGIPTKKIIPKNMFITLMSLLFEHDLISLQERNEHEQMLHREIVLYDPSQTAEKYKGDQCEAMLHTCFHLAGGKDFLRELLGIEQAKMVYAL